MTNEQAKTICSYAPIILAILSIYFANTYKPLSFITVEKAESSSTLYFPGIANPKQIYQVISPVTGIILKMDTSYGKIVSEGQILFVIKSEQMESNFRNALESYIKAKSSYQQVLFDNAGNAELYKLGLIAKIDFLNKQDQLKSSQLALWDADIALKKLLEKTGALSASKLSQLSMENMEEIKKIIHNPLNGINILAPHEGILLFPKQADDQSNSSSSSTHGLGIGASIQEGQVVAIIANTTGLSFEFNLNETDYYNVHAGQLATIKINAFPSMQLQGKVTYISSEANNSRSGSIPTYKVKIEVPQLTAKEKKIIKIGMSVEIALTKKEGLSISVPLSAVYLKKKRYWVNVIDPKTEIVRSVPVKVGDANEESIKILDGLVAGEHVVITH